MDERQDGWVATTHDWSTTADGAHIEFVRRHSAEYARGGALHLLLEVLAYAEDEASELGRPGRCTITLGSDGSVRVGDDGRGTDTRRGPDGTVVRKPIMATKDLRFFDADEQVLLPDGLPRRGMSVVAALSEWLIHLNRRHDGAWEQRYEQGLPVADLAEWPDPTGETGTTIWFLPDAGLVPNSSLTIELVREVDRFPSLILQLEALSA